MTQEHDNPQRAKIIKLLSKKQMTAAQIGSECGWTRERAYNYLNKMQRANLVTKLSRSNQVFWGEYKAPPARPAREPQMHNGTMKDRLSLSYMKSPYREGAMDAFALKSGAQP